MECELILLGSLPKGNLSHGSSSNEVMTSVCPTGKLVAMVSSSYEAQFITGETGEAGGDDPPSFLYSNGYQGLLDIAREAMSTKPRPQATAVMVVPIAFKIQSGVVQSSSIVLVGFSDGFVRGYSKSGQRVLSQLMHTEPVKRISCMASPPIGSSNSNLCNVVVSYPDHVCVVEGESLVNVIRTYVQNRTADDEEEASLSYKKWKLMDQTSTSDVALLGHSTPSLFDHLCEASTVGGFDTTLRSTPSPEAFLITVGESPMIALYKITKDAGHLNMSEVVSAVASKMRSAVLGKISQASGWLGWGKGSSPSPKPAAKKEPVHLSTNLPMSSNVPDARRSVLSTVVSPLGNLAAAVDCFGRVLLLETETLTIRRMWKGYRDAQCGWMLVSDSAAAGRSSRGRRKRPHTPPPSGKKAQCLCIYAPRRGILELWPVISGSRVGVFQVGENCQLLYSSHGTFTFDLSDTKVGVASGRGFRHAPVLLCPDGSLVTVSIPFPMLTRLGDPTSFDAHLMKKLPQAIKNGDWDTVVGVITTLRSSHSMKQAVDLLLGAHETESLSYDIIIKMLNIALERVDGIDPATGPLLMYLQGVWQGVELLQGIAELITTAETKTDSLEDMLCSSCGLPRERAAVITTTLNTYFSNHSLKKTVVKNFDLKSFLKCFKLPSKVGNVLLSSSKVGEETGGVVRSSSRSQPVRLALRDGLANPTLLDLGSALFKKLLSADSAEYSLATLFSSCGIPNKDLLRLVSVVFVSGALPEKNPSHLLRRLNKLLPLITSSPAHVDSPGSSVTSKTSVSAGGEELWEELVSQCSLSCSTGHALLLALVAHKLATASSDDKIESDDQDWESWESLSSVGEHWISLSHQLELLTLVSNLIGQDSMPRLPHAPYTPKDADSANIDPGHIELISSEAGMCVDSLSKYGSALIAHCVGGWLVANQIPAEFVARIPSDPHDNPETKYSKVVFQMSPLLKLLPLTLSHEALLLHCAWQAVTLGNSPLDYLAVVGTIKSLRGVIGVLWVCLFERQVVSVISSLKRGGVVSQAARSAVTIGRILFSWLYRISGHKGENGSQESESLRDLVSLPCDTRLVCHLSELAAVFPSISPTVVRTYLELLLLTEVALATHEAVNIIPLFPTWLRGALSKGAYKCAWQEQVPVQLHQKRTKYLCELVKIYLSDESPPAVLPSLTCRAMDSLPPSNSTEIASHKDIAMLLADLWGVDGDTVRKQWACAFFAAGLGDKGTEVFQDIGDKTRASHDLLSFSGQLCDVLLNSMENQTRQLALMAQLSPSLLEYLRNQGKRPIPSVCTRVTPSWACLSQLLAIIQPYLASRTSQSSILAALVQLAHKCSP